MIDEPWNPADIIIARANGPQTVYGYVRKGLGIFNHGWRTPRIETQWTLIHLGSGSAVTHLTGDVRQVMPVAFAIAECGEWDLFDLPDGWKQTDPDLMAKTQAICDAHPEVRPNIITGQKVSTEEARAVIAMREGANDLFKEA